MIQEKTQEEHVVRPIAAPRRTTFTTTSATQTDLLREGAPTSNPDCRAPLSAKKRPAGEARHKNNLWWCEYVLSCHLEVFILPGKKPQKPPRPSPPKALAPESVAPIDEEAGTNTVSTVTEDQSDSKSDINQPNQASSSHACTRSVTVYWDIPTKPAETTPSSSDSEHNHRPVPLPRTTKPGKQVITEEVEVQTLVKLSENCDSTESNPEEISSNEYLKELLEVFTAANECEENSDTVNQTDGTLQGEDAGGEMNSSHSQRNIRARIQAFESQASTDEGIELAKPEPQLRKSTNKPPVAAKPSVALKPQLNHSADDDSQNVTFTNIPQHPTPAPRPQPPKKPTGLSINEEPETALNKMAIPNRSRPVLTRTHSIYVEEPLPVPPTPPVKPVKEPLKPNLNINNHNSTTMHVDSPPSE